MSWSVACLMLECMDITIREARGAEFDEIAELTARAYLDDGLLQGGEGSPYLAKLRDVPSRARHAEVLVAVRSDSEEIVGTVTFVPRGGEYANIARPGEGEFRMLAVRSSGRGRGVGEALVRECLTRATALGLTRVVLSSDLAMTTAHRLYRRLGFVRTPERDWAPRPDVPLWTFAIELPR